MQSNESVQYHGSIQRKGKKAVMDERWMKGLEQRLRARIRKRLLSVAKPYAAAKTRGERGKTREESEGDEQKRMRGERVDKSENPAEAGGSKV